MSLTSSLFSGISGLGTLGNSMQIVGDNIANVNTIGFKGSSYIFQDLLAQSIGTQSGTSQIGRGVALADVNFTYQQGSFETTGNTTDMGIGGEGFFILREPGDSERLFYSRAGNFRFDKDGFLINPEGYVVQGWELDEDADDIGFYKDILLTSFTSPPDETDHVTIISNVDADTTSNVAWMANAWDGTADTPIASTNYEYQATIKAYDSLGSSHDVTIYYDKESNTEANWEYIVTCNPQDDRRSFITANDVSAGLLARGLINFSDSSGTILPTGLSMETLTATGGHTQGLSNYVYTGGSNGFTAPNTTVTVNDHNALTDTDTGIILARSLGGVWSLSGNSATGDYASAAIFPEPLNVVAASAGFNISDTYTFTVAAGGTVGTNILSINWVSTTNTTGGTFTVPVGATPITVADIDGAAVGPETMGLTFTAGNLSVGDVFTMTTTAIGLATVGNVPLDSGFSISLDGTATVASDTEITVAFATPITSGGNGTLTFDIAGATTNNGAVSTPVWTTELTNVNGYYEFNPDFIGGAGGVTVMDVELDLGTSWDGTAWENDSLTTTQFARSSTTSFQNATGYGAGDFQGVDVDVDGVMTGIYSNGQLIPLYRVALGKFLNAQELYKEGGSLYRATRDSGDAITGHPGTGGLGSITANSLEQSNVDIANEFVRMITSQRGFQANSKIITTVDAMLGEVINMKR